MTVYKAEFLTPGLSPLVFGQPSDNPDFILDDIDGISGGDVTVYTEKTPFQQGDSFIDSNYSGRVINMVFQIRGDNISTARDTLHTILSPLRRNSVLRLTRRGDGYNPLSEVVREIDCVVSSPPVFVENKNARTKRFLRGVVSFYCADPFFRDSTLKTINLGELQGYRTLTIDGNAPTDFKLTFLNASVTDLIAIEMTKMSTGEFVKTQKLLLPVGSSFTLDTKFGDKKLFTTDSSMNVVDRWDRLNANSIFFQLTPPQEEYFLNFTTEFGGWTTTIQYYPRWLGV